MISQMSRFPEISSLFSAIASNLRTLDPTARRKDQNVDISISNLNRSLNLGGTSRVRILVTALSLMCFTAPQNMEGRKGDLCDMLLDAVIRLAALAPGLQNILPSTPIHILKFCNPEAFALPGLLSHVPKEVDIKNDKVPLRLLWHLDPTILKRDVSQILQEVIKRPFLHLGMEIYKRGEWQSKVVCPVTKLVSGDISS